MKKSESKDEEMARLVELLISGSNVNQVHYIVEDLSEEMVQDLCTNILKNGHTLLHLLAQRQKLQALQALLQHKGSASDVLHTRNAQGCTPLHVALLHNALFSAKVLLDHGANPSEVVSRHKGTTLLHLMVTCDRPHAVMLLLREGADPNAQDFQGRTPFHLAAILGNATIAAILLREEQVDLNAVDGSGHTGVMLAITNNNPELARQLVEAPGVDIVRRDKDGMSCLHLAVSLGQLDVVRSLLRRNTANINGKERCMGRTPIHFACSLTCDVDGAVTTSSYLMNRSGAAAEVPDALNGSDAAPASGSVKPRRQESPSAAAAAAAEADFADVVSNSNVIKKNVPPISVSLGSPRYSRFQKGPGHQQKKMPSVNGHIGDSTPRTPRTSRTPRTPRVRTPVRTPRTSTPRAYTPRVVVSTDSNLAEPALADSPRRKTTVGSADSMHHSRHSISGDQMAFTPRPQSYLVLTPVKSTKQSACSESGGSSRQPSQRPSTAPAVNLHRHFSSTFPTSLVKFRIPSAVTGRESAASHRSRDSSVVTPITPFNVGLIRSKLVALLLSYDADANLMTTFRKSPLHITSILGAADVMSLLLPHITNINVLSASNKTALHLAVEGGFTSLVSQLINAGANLMMRDISGMTALHLAARLGHTDIVSLLIKAKVDMNCCNFQQRMPLHYACLHSHIQVIDLLVRAGACLDRPDDDGVLPLEYRERASGSNDASTTQKGNLNASEKAGPQMTMMDTAAAVGQVQTDAAATSLMPQRRRKMGIIQPANGNGAQLPTQDYPKVPNAVVLCSVVAI